MTHPAQTMALHEYVRRRNGTPLGGSGSLGAVHDAAASLMRGSLGGST